MFFSSQLLSVILIGIFLSILGILNPWFQQSILWSYQNYFGKGPGISLARIGDTLLIPGVSVIFLFTFLFLNIFSQKLFPHGKFARNILIAFSVSIFSLIVVNMQEIKPEPPFTLFNYSVFLKTISYKLPFLFTFTVLTLYVILIIYKIVVSLFQRKNQILPFDMLAIGLIFQLYPLTDPYHIFVVVPGLLYAISRSDLKFLLHLLPKSTALSIDVFRVGIISWVVVLVIQNFYLGLNTDYKYSKGVLGGIHSRSYNSSQLEGQMTATWAKDIEDTVVLLSNRDYKRQIRFECKEGFYSAADGEYLADDPFFVDWGPIPIIRKEPNYIFYCALNENRLRYVLSGNVELIFKTTFSESPMSSSGELFYVLVKVAKVIE